MKNKFSLYGEFIIDDLQIDDTGIDHAFGYKIGADGKILINDNNYFLIFEYTQISPWAYLHHGQNTNWINNKHPIGFPFGPDSKCAQIKIIADYTNKISLLADASYLVKGMNTILSEWNNGSTDYYHETSDKYFLWKLGMVIKHKWGRFEFGLNSKIYENIIAPNSLSFNQSSMFFAELFLDNSKTHNIN
tara:strand:- start:138 stop:707 length:570 start_codon:yes stop_codon:yes gene_type:complete